MVMSEKVKRVIRHRWVVFVCAMWVESFAGMSYMFGSISPIIKSTMGFNQKQLALLATAKDLGDNIGYLAGKLAHSNSPISRLYLVGAIHNVIGYSFIWLTVTHRIPYLPLWALCILIYVGTNANTYYTTASLVSCVNNFPENRGDVVGILKGFMGLSGAIITQILAIIHTPDKASLIFIIAVAPTIVALSLMFIIRPLSHHHHHATSSSHDSSGFFFVYTVCLLLASYLLAVLLLENVVHVDQTIIRFLGLILLLLILLPVLVPIAIVFFFDSGNHDEDITVTLLTSSMAEEQKGGGDSISLLRFQLGMIFGAVKRLRVKGMKKKIGEDFTLMEALATLDLWLLFGSLILGSGSGLTIINNMGQICESLGDNNANLYVSLMSIFNFLGRVCGGYLSEVIIRKLAYPRLVAVSVVQFMMTMGLSYCAMGLSGQLYVVTVVTAFGYGAHWSIAVAAVSELFGLKNFGALYNFLTIATPTGSLILSGLVASTIYDYYAQIQAQTTGNNDLLVCRGSICYSTTCAILAAACLFAMLLSLIVVHRTKRVYAQLYANSPTLL